MKRAETVEPIVDDRLTFEGMIGSCEAMRKVFDQVERAGRAGTTVLVRGESGTGKELVAHAIHRNSLRQDGPFVAINMAAVPETLIESELFGHVKGAFTGADTNRVGRFEAAHGGTLFVDEIGDLGVPSQAKLLRVMENRLITPVGSNETKEVDVRVVFATNRNLERLVSEGRFREDLYYRINVVTISLPPVRERHEDIRLLVDHFLDEVCTAKGKPRASPDAALLHFLETYDWPGNVRQLRSCLESMVILADSAVLTVDDLPALVGGPARYAESCCGTCRHGDLDSIVKEIVLLRLQRYGGNRTQTAQSLGISSRTLQRHLKMWEHDNKAHGKVAPAPGQPAVTQTEQDHEDGVFSTLAREDE